ncbi:hypothetical protein C7N43_24825 [Sphingobacteriales bacterium UPWRP_1]|nr:hypothetical protein B6N25_09580 [Sphingobacteriales bacterium TSM_CSS]PSJ74284.1 hypothetical protein C7N43_24825 [Sphingobacteriales bacterium UPWRP_1]
MKNIYCAVLLVLGLLAVTHAVAQTSDPKLKKANQLFDAFSFPDAAEQYKKILAKDDNIAEAKIKLAECYRLMNMPIEAEYWYEQVVELPESEPVHKYHYGMALKMNGKFDRAKQMFLEYAQLVPADSRGLRQAEACEQANYFLTNPGIYQLNLAASVNTEKADFGPAFYREGIVYASESNVKDKTKMYNWREQPFLDLFYAKQDGDNPSNLTAPEAFKGKVNTWVHEGTVAFSQDFETMYFTRNNYINGITGYDTEEIMNTVNLKIYEAKSEGGGERWGSVKSLPFNNDDYSVGHPTLSADGQALYFVSDMPGGYGETDIYVSYLSGDSWSAPENLGPEINTEGREMFPFISKDGTLYFASDALPGLGGLDVFSSQLQDDGTWSAPENLRYPINTNADDFAFIIDASNSKGYLSSNRPGGKGDDDIYSFTKLTNVLIGVVVDCNTQQPIEGAKVELMENGKLMQKRTSNAKGGFSFPISPGKQYVVNASKTDYEDGSQQISTVGMSGTQVEVKIPICPKTGPNGATTQAGAKCKGEGTVLDKASNKPVSGTIVTLTNVDTREEKTFVTGADGKYSFELDSESDYVIHAAKEYYFTEVKSVSTKGRDCASPDQSNMPLDFPIVKVIDENKLGPNGQIQPSDQVIITDGIPSEVLNLNHIYYDFDQHYIRKDAKPELDKVVDFMYRNPSIILELRSHTDSRGTHEYNQALSERRAQSALNYIIGRGVTASRISAKGFGETQLTNECSDGIPCDDAKHQNNRRTEFAVVGYAANAIYSAPRYFGIQDYHRGKNYYKSKTDANGHSSYNSDGSYSPSSSGSSYDSGSSSSVSESSSSYVTESASSSSSSGGGKKKKQLPHAYSTDFENSSSGSSNADNSSNYASTTTASSSSTPTYYDNLASSAPAVATSGSGSGAEYRIQLGVFHNPDLSQFDKLADIGKLTLETSTSGDAQRVLIGNFSDQTSADEAMYKVKQRGFKDAFLVNYNNGLRMGRKP